MIRRRTDGKRSASSRPSGDARKASEATSPPTAATTLPEAALPANSTSDRETVADTHRTTRAHAAIARSTPRRPYCRKE